MKRRPFLIITIISLFIMLCLSACGSQAQPSLHNGTIAQNQRDVTYPGVSGVTLAGTLVIPAHKSGVKVPGVLIVAGSGPVDRNGNEGTAFVTNLYSQLADQLAQQGIPTLPYNNPAAAPTPPHPLLKYPNHPPPPAS